MPREPDEIEEDHRDTEPGPARRELGPADDPTGDGLWYEPEDERPRNSWVAPLAFLVAVAVVCFGAGYGWWWLELRFPQGDIEIVVPIDEEAAVMGVAGRSHDWLVRWDRGGRRRWVVGVPQLEPWTPYGGVSVAGGVLTVRGDDGETVGTTAIDVETGEVLWNGLLRPKAEAPLPRSVTHLFDDESLYELVDGVVVAVDRRTGAERWRAALDRVPVRGWARDGWLGFDTRGGFVAIATADGSVLESFAATGVCVTGGDPLVGRSTAAEIVATLPDGTLRRGPPGAPVVAPWTDAPLVGLCGTYNGLLVAAIENVAPPPGPDAPKEERERWAAMRVGAHLVGIEGGSIVWATHLAQRSFAVPDQEYRLAYPDREAFSGDLPRFLPLLLSDHSAPGREWAVAMHVVDLDTGEVAWQTDAYVLNGQNAVVRSGDRTLVVSRNLVAGLDATTGELTAGARVVGDGALAPWHLVGDTLWISRLGGIGTLDTQTLHPHPDVWGTLRFEDGRSEIEKVFARSP